MVLVPSRSPAPMSVCRRAQPERIFYKVFRTCIERAVVHGITFGRTPSRMCGAPRALDVLTPRLDRTRRRTGERLIRRVCAMAERLRAGARMSVAKAS